MILQEKPTASPFSQALACELALESKDASKLLSGEKFRELLETDITENDEKCMLDTLPLTNDRGLRHLIALKILNDSSPACKKASVPILKRIMEEPRTARYRGTLLYVLHEMKAPLSLSFLLNQIKESDATYEVQCEVFQIIDERLSEFSSQEIKNSFRLVENVNLQENECMHDVLEFLKEEMSERECEV